MAGLTLSAVLATVGTGLSVVGQMQSANQQRAAMDYQARQLEAKAKAEQAVSIKEAEAIRRRGMLDISRARAVAGASGGGQDFDLLGDLAAQTELDALTAQWEGTEAASGLKDRASAARFEGRQMQTAGRWGAMTSAVSGGATLYDRYGGAFKK